MSYALKITTRAEKSYVQNPDYFLNLHYKYKIYYLL